MVFEVPEDYEKVEESAKNHEEPSVSNFNAEGGDSERTNLTPIMDEAPADDADM